MTRESILDMSYGCIRRFSQLEFHIADMVWNSIVCTASTQPDLVLVSGAAIAPAPDVLGDIAASVSEQDSERFRIPRAMHEQS